jgi:adenylate cyclase
MDRDSEGVLIAKELTITRKDEKNSTLKIPLNPDGTVLLRFFGSQNSRPFAIPKFSVARVSAHLNALSRVYEMNETHPLEKKLVIVGPTALAVYDLRPNPVQKDGGGVYIHANMAARILEAFKKGTSPVMRYASLTNNLLVLVFSVLLVCLLTISMGGFKGVWFYIVLIAGLIYFDIKIFHDEGIVFESFSVLLSSIFALVSVLAYKYFTEERDRAFVKGAFEKYVSPDVVGSIIADPKKLNLGGERRELSVLFSDVRGFTNISERMGAAELAKFMNDYLTPMTEIVLEERGTIDKYMGDAIMAIFGAPIGYDTHAQQAVKAGLRMLARLEELKVGWKEKGLPPIDIGVGVNTGEMSVGNMGSTRIFSYTVMGDAVNLGSRLEGLTKEYDVKFIVSEFTRAKLGDEFVLRELDRVKVKGKDTPVTIFEVMGLSSDPRAEQWRAWATRFEEALNLYYAQKFDEASKIFWELDDQKLPTAELYVKRCALWAQNPPPASWDGSWTMKTK